MSSKAETLAYDLEAEVVTRVIADKAAAELRRLAALEKAIMDAEPVAWMSTDCIGERYLCFTKPNDNDPAQPLYTLNGIKP